ncbi:MAG TPA: polysaccharide biosynthesis tyrosine autokinase [Chthoniobacteraceae bacterium]
MDSLKPEAPAMPFGASLGAKFYRYRTLIRRHWWILALCICLGVAYQAYVAFNKPQLYESVSRLNIREELVTNLKGGFTDGTGNFFGTTIDQVKSQLVQEHAYEKLRLTAPNLSDSVEITPNVPPRSNILTVTGVGKNPEFTRLYVDAVVQEFLSLKDADRGSTGKQVSERLQERLTTTKEELAMQKKALQDFAEANNMEFWQEQGRSSAKFLSGLKDKQAQLENELQRLENLTPDQLLTSSMQTSAPRSSANAQPGTGRENPAANSESAPSFNSELYTEYLRKRQELIQRQADFATWKEVWKPKHPRLQKIQEDIRRLTLAIDTIREQNKEATASRIVTVKAELKSLEASIQNWDGKVREASRKDAQYTALQGELTRTQGQLDTLMSSQETVSHASTASLSPWVVMEPARPAVVVPRGTTKHILTGLLGGFVVGMIILLVLDRADDRLSSSTEMLEHFSEPILGQIPNVADTRQSSGLPLLQIEDERYTYAEAFRSLRSSLIFMPNQSELKTVLVTSAIPNEGKSTLSSNLAITMAAAGARVLLVDADLRRGDLAQLFDVEGQKGLSNILRGEIDWKEAVLQTPYPTLSLISRGPVTNQSGELLLKPMLVSLLDEFKEAYDLTIFNTAPILATDDTPTLAPNFDGALMVVRAQFTSARMTQNALNALYQRQVNVLGLILNAIDTEMPDYYYYRYPKYYAA